jgi:oligosaccharide repeat unit polymerase
LIPFLNVTSYRGTIEYGTLTIYSIVYILVVIFFALGHHISKGFRSKSSIYLYATTNAYVLAQLHIIISYATLLYIYSTYGNILLDQSIRFTLDAKLTYVVVSTVYIPLYFSVCRNIRFTTHNTLVFIILPLLPPLFIGSRSVVVAIFFGILLVRFLMIEEKKVSFNWITEKTKDISRMRIMLLGSLVLGIFTVVYFFRRLSSKTSFTDSISSYIDVELGFFAQLLIAPILPLYFNLRETVGLTNRILIDNLHNTTSELPLFLSELITFLPGKQVSPGVVFGDMVGKVQEGGLTPGMIGGIYLDFGYVCVIVPAIVVFLISSISVKAISHDGYKLVLSLFTIQFIHLYHRGFLKLEYLTAYVILFLYISVSRRREIPNPSKASFGMI